MQQKDTGNRKKKKSKFLKRMQEKLAVLFILVLLAFVGLSVRLVYINKNQNTYQKKVLSQQRYDSTTIPFKRGNIEDTNGTLLAVSEKVYNVIVDNKVMLADEANVEPTIKALVDCFGIDEAELRKSIKENPTLQYCVWKKRLTYDEISGFKELQADTKNNPNIKGVWFEEEYIRNYPNSSLACDVIGFVGSDNNGTYGLEEYYNDELNGTNGREYGYLNDDETLERSTVPAVDGNTLVTTIDANIQSIVEKNIIKFNKEHENEYREGLGSTNTGCIVMDPNSGEILAMASYPNFDLNNPKDLSEYYTPEALAELEKDNDKYYEALNALWKNFCISQTYEPGSTAKCLTIATGLESGKIKGDETYFCDGALQVGNYRIKCNVRSGHGTLDVSGALEQSCNVALMHMAEAIGKTTFLKGLETFNIGLKTNIDLAGEARTASLVFNEDTMHETELATSSFGQGYNVTMIQMAAAFSSIINGGYYYEPHVVKRIENETGATVKNIEPRILKQTISSSTSEKMVEYLTAVVAEGTGKAAKPAGYAIGGKTGTAEKFPRGTGNYVVSFIGFAPADDPQVVVYVVIDEPNVADQPHSTFASTIVRDIMTEVLPYMNIFMTEELTIAEQEELANWQITTPAENTQTENTQTENGENAQNGEEGENTEAGAENTQTNTGEATNTGPSDTGGDTNNSNNTTQGEGIPEANAGPVYTVDPNTGELINSATGEPAEINNSIIEELGENSTEAETQSQ